MEIRIHSRGGQGAVTASEILVAAIASEGKHACAFPMFGFERRGSPVTTFLRFSGKPIREKTMVYEPDCLLVLDTNQVNMPASYAGLKPGGMLVANVPEHFKIEPNENVKTLGVVDATSIALDEIGAPIVSTCMLGAFAATSQWVELESVVSALGHYLEGKILEKNIKSVERGFHETKVVK
jgi:2-oxoacid:acceptor oxidoreductase gamma subunit (pyruvate/2-ketoisovalerate family)